jgi:hypothetical protein
MRSVARIGRSPVHTLELVTTASWGGNACFGIWLLVGWRLRNVPAVRITSRPALPATAHPTLAIAGLLLWVVFLRTRDPVYAWCSFGAIATAAMLGFLMLTMWLEGRAGRHARGSEARFPVPIVTLHGVVGVGTFALVLITVTLATQHR